MQILAVWIIQAAENAVDLLFGFVYRIFLFCGEVAQRRARQNGKIGIGLLEPFLGRRSRQSPWRCPLLAQSRDAQCPDGYPLSHTQTTRRVAHSRRCLRDQGCAECHHAGGAVMKRPVKERAED